MFGGDSFRIYQGLVFSLSGLVYQGLVFSLSGLNSKLHPPKDKGGGDLAVGDLRFDLLERLVQKADSEAEKIRKALPCS